MHSTLLFHLLIYAAGTLSTPVDYPIKVDLPVYEDPESFNGVSNIHLAEPLLPQNHPGVDTLHKNEPDLVHQKLGAIKDTIDYKTRVRKTKYL